MKRRTRAVDRVRARARRERAREAVVPRYATGFADLWKRANRDVGRIKGRVRFGGKTWTIKMPSKKGDFEIKVKDDTIGQDAAYNITMKHLDTGIKERWRTYDLKNFGTVLAKMVRAYAWHD